MQWRFLHFKQISRNENIRTSTLWVRHTEHGKLNCIHIHYL